MAEGGGYTTNLACVPIECAAVVRSPLAATNEIAARCMGRGERRVYAAMHGQSHGYRRSGTADEMGLWVTGTARRAFRR